MVLALVGANLRRWKQGLGEERKGKGGKGRSGQAGLDN